MPQSTYAEGQRLQGSDGKIYVVRGGVPVEETSAPTGSVFADPYKAPRSAADLAKARAEAVRATAETDPAYLKAQRDKAVADAQKAQIDAQTAANGQNNPNTAAVRAAALQAYNAARLLNGQIATMREKFAAGPGSTSGIMGITDYFGGPANNEFDNAANAARGSVGTTLGFTGGQLNTAREAAMNVGPYLPQSSDWDSVAREKMAQLEELRDKSIRQAIQTLGGVPDANGNVTPVPNGVDPVEFAKRTWAPAPAPANQPNIPSIRPPGGGGGGGGNGGQPFRSPDVIPQLQASGSDGGAVVGAGYNAVPNPAGEALYKDYLSLWAANAPDETIRQWSKKVYGGVNPDVEAALAARRQGRKIQFYPGDNLLTTNVPRASDAPGMPDFLRLSPSKVADSAASTPVGTFMANAGNTSAAGIPQWLAGKVSGNPDLANLRYDVMNAQNPKSAFWGQMAGSALGSAGAEFGAARLLGKFPMLANAAGRASRIATWAPRVGDLTYGAVSGATSNPDNPFQGALLGGTLGTVGGMGGRAAARGLGAGFKGVQNEAIRELSSRGIPLTFGQAVSQSGKFGAFLKRTEDAAMSIPGVGDALNWSRRGGFQGFNAAAFRDGLAPIGKDTGGLVAEQGVDNAIQKAGQGFDFLNGQNVTIPLNSGDPFMSAVTKGATSRTGAGDFVDILDRNIAPIANRGTISGRDFQKLERSTGGYARKYDAIANGTATSPAQPGYEPIRDAFRDMNGALFDAADSSNPSLAGQYRDAKDAWRNTMILQDAVNRARNGTRSGETGLFAPSQLSDAAASNAAKFGGTQGTTRQPFFDLTRAGQQVLPSSVADSGTANRLMVGRALGGLGLAGGGTAEGLGYDDNGVGAKTATTLGMLALLASPMGQKALRGVVLKRPNWMFQTGSAIDRAAPYAGILGAPLALQQSGF